MDDEEKTEARLINELVALRQRVADLEVAEGERKWAGEAARALEALLDITSALGLTLDLKQILKIIGQRMARAVGAERCSITLKHKGHLVPVMSQFADGHPDTKLWVKFTALRFRRMDEVPAHTEAIRTKRPVMIEDTASSYLTPAYWLEEFGIRAALLVPLVRKDEVIGILILDRTNAPYAWGQAQIDLAMMIANQAALAIENARLFQRQARLREAQTLLTVSQAVSSTLDLTERMRRVARESSQALAADMVGVFLADPAQEYLCPVAGYHVPKHLLEAFMRFPIPLKGHRAVEEAWEHHRPTYTSDAEADPRIDRETIHRFPQRSVLFAPMIIKGELVGGIFVTWWEQKHHFTPEELRLVEGISRQGATALENAQLFEQVRAGRARLQNLSRQLVKAQEAERRRIARELHDEIGQALTGLKLTLEVSTRVPAGATGVGVVEAKALVNEIIGKVRDLSLALRPAMLDDFGLLPALLWHFERYTLHTKVHVAFEHAGLKGRRFGSETETAVYRLVQEALTNVARHAGVSEVTVRLWTDPATLYVQVEDQGSGFDSVATQASRICTGLDGMRERAALVGGHITLESAPGAGTRLTAELPLGDSDEGGRKERRDGQDDNSVGG